MDNALKWIKARIAAVALSTASVITALQLVTPSFLDLLFNLIVLGLLYAVIKLNGRPQP
jgi:hypothetical protein